MHKGFQLELDELKKWHLRPRFRSLADHFVELARREFVSQDEQLEIQNRALASLAVEAEVYAPWYRSLFRDLGISAADLSQVSELAVLPMLTRLDIQANEREMQSSRYSRELGNASYYKTSGTSGQPLRVLRSTRSSQMFEFLKQRELRMFRFDPQGVFASIRSPTDLPVSENGERLAKEDSYEFSSWPLVGTYFETGPALAFGCDNPVELQLDWLDQHRPDYLLAHSSDIEHIALTAQGQSKEFTKDLKGMLAISQQMEPSMRTNIARSISAPVEQNYGLNEVGLVAVRCPSSGYYHVHSGNCIVEISDENGQPKAQGEPGHLLVTGLNSHAMPIFRYDTGDYATIPTTPCDCGRSLPSFYNLQGRYRRNAFLPAGTLNYWDAVLNALEVLPETDLNTIQQYQLHQFRSKQFEFRVVCSGILSENFKRKFLDSIHQELGQKAAKISLLQVAEIPRPSSGKFQNFTSDFIPE